MAKTDYFSAEELDRMPTHVAAIMDGNGRWAKSKGLPRTAGHREGAEVFRRAAEFMADIGVKYFTVYAFSAENWKRPAEEVGVIMGLFERYLNEAVDTMARRKIRLVFFGDLSPLSPRLLKLIERTEEISRGLTDGKLCVNVCINYGGRQEIARAAKAAAIDLASGKIAEQDITPELLSGYMYSAGIPDPDLIIRPGRELRQSNFLLWQSAYSEFYYTDKMWPEMDEDALAEAIRSYMGRNRRFGGL